MATLVQDFYKQVISIAWAAGTGKRYVSVKPTPTQGILVISPSSESLREIIRYTSTGTDGSGDYIMVSERGVGGTSDQTHEVQEPIRMNVTGEHIDEIYAAMAAIVAGGAQDASTLVKGIGRVATAPASPTDPVFVGDNDPRVPTTVEKARIPSVDVTAALVGTGGAPSTTNKFVTEVGTSVDVDQSQTTGSTPRAVGEADATTRQNLLAQSFTPVLTKIRGARLYKSANTGTFTGTVKLALQADTAGSPSGSDLASVTMTNAQYNALPVGEFQMTFGTEYDTLVPGALYWLVVTCSTSDNSNHPNLGTNAAGGYTGGTLKFKNTTDGWTLIATADLYFKTLGGLVSQVAKTDASGSIPPAFIKGLLKAAGLTAGTSVTGTTAETASYSTTIDATYLLDILKRLRVRITAASTFANNSSQSAVIRIKVGGVTIGSFTISATNATSPTGTCLLEAILYSDANGALFAQSFGLGIPGTNITSVVVAMSNAALSSQPALTTATTLEVTVQLSHTSGSGILSDIIVERL